MAKKKKKLTNKELAEKLKKAKVKDIEKYKKEKDSKFRKEARNEIFVPTIDLNTEIRLKTIKKKGPKGEIQAQKNRVAVLEKENRKIASKRKDLQREYPFAEDDRKKEIKRLLDSPDYKKKDLFKDKNLLKYLNNENFDFVVNDGFKTYKISLKDAKKYIKSGKDITLPILKKIKKDNLASIKKYDRMIKKESKTATKSRLKKLRRIRDGLKDKLKHTIDKNIEALETGNMKVLDEYNEQGEKAYSLLFKVVGFNVDRIGI